MTQSGNYPKISSHEAWNNLIETCANEIRKDRKAFIIYLLSVFAFILFVINIWLQFEVDKKDAIIDEQRNEIESFTKHHNYYLFEPNYLLRNDSLFLNETLILTIE